MFIMVLKVLILLLYIGVVKNEHFISQGVTTNYAQFPFGEIITINNVGTVTSGLQNPVSERTRTNHELTLNSNNIAHKILSQQYYIQPFQEDGRYYINEKRQPVLLYQSSAPHQIPNEEYKQQLQVQNIQTINYDSNYFNRLGMNVQPSITRLIHSQPNVYNPNIFNKQTNFDDNSQAPFTSVPASSSYPYYVNAKYDLNSPIISKIPFGSSESTNEQVFSYHIEPGSTKASLQPQVFEKFSQQFPGSHIIALPPVRVQILANRNTNEAGQPVPNLQKQEFTEFAEPSRTFSTVESPGDYSGPPSYLQTITNNGNEQKPKKGIVQIIPLLPKFTYMQPVHNETCKLCCKVEDPCLKCCDFTPLLSQAFLKSTVG